MSDPTFSVNLVPGDPPVVVVVGDVDVLTAPDVWDVLEAACASAPAVVIDAAGLGFCDSSGLNLLARAARLGTSLTLRQPPANLLRLLTMTGIDAIVTVEP